MRKQFYLHYFLLLSTLFCFDSYAYEIVSETITVAPGSEGGVLYSKIESGNILSMPKNTNSNSQIETEFDHEENQSIQ